MKALFTKRNRPAPPSSRSDCDEWDFYDALTRFVEDQSIKAASDDSARGRALGFTMAMLQRRFASSIYAVRRSLQRMKEKREQILADPEAYRQAQINKRLPDDFEDLPEEEQQEILPNWKTWSRLMTRRRCARKSLELGKLIQLGQCARKAGSRNETRPAEGAHQRARRLHRPEDEAAHLHRTQGHARFSVLATAKTDARSANCANGD